MEGTGGSGNGIPGSRGDRSRLGALPGLARRRIRRQAPATSTTFPLVEERRRQLLLWERCVLRWRLLLRWQRRRLIPSDSPHSPEPASVVAAGAAGEHARQRGAAAGVVVERERADPGRKRGRWRQWTRVASTRRPGLEPNAEHDGPRPAYGSEGCCIRLSTGHFACSGTAASRTTVRCAVQSASGPERSTSASHRGRPPTVAQSSGTRRCCAIRTRTPPGTPPRAGGGPGRHTPTSAWPAARQNRSRHRNTRDPTHLDASVRLRSAVSGGQWPG